MWNEAALPQNDKRRLIKTCLDHATHLLDASKLLAANGDFHFAYHFAVLALEEIGKSSILQWQSDDTLGDETDEGVGIDDHVKKLFWAIWLPTFGREVITEEQVKDHRGQATELHNLRLRALYAPTNAQDFYVPRAVVSEETYSRFLKMAEARLNLAIHQAASEPDESARPLADWFLQACDIPHKRKVIFGGASMARLIEIGNFRDWIHWLRDAERGAEAYAQRRLEQEQVRDIPEEASTPKWRFRLRFFTESQSVKDKAFSKWNARAVGIKLYAVDKSRLVGKSFGRAHWEVVADFTAFSSLGVDRLWEFMRLSGTRFLIALNIGSRGFFWWNLPVHISRFYEEVEDLETHETVEVDINPAFQVNWGHKKLTENDMDAVALCFAMIGKLHDPLLPCLQNYYFALNLLSKTDILGDFADRACYHLYVALKLADVHLRFWENGVSLEDGLTAFGREHMEAADAEHFSKQVEALKHCDELTPPKERFTLGDAFTLKILCDSLLIIALNKRAVDLQEAEANNEDTR